MGAGSAGGPLQALGGIERSTRRERILIRLRDALSNGELPPGTHLAEVELSESLEVSRGTLREALRHLQQEGLVVADTRGRLRVRRVTGREVHEIFAVRAALESLASDAVCGRADRAAAVGRLRTALAEMGADGPLADRIDRDLVFHETLCAASGNGVLVESWRHVRGLARASITAAGEPTASINMSPDRHRPIVEAIERGDAAEARGVIVAHMTDAAEKIVSHLPAG